MARASSVISVAITGDSRKLQGAVRGAEKSVSGFGGSMKRAAVGIGGALVGLFAVSKAFDFIGDSLGEADRAGDALTNLNRIVGKVNTKKIEKAADDFLKLGLSSQDVLELSVGFARIAKAIGLKPKLIATYAADISAVAQALSLVDEKGRPASKWVEIIGKAASKPNNTRMLQLLGISISEAGVIKRALEATGKTSAADLTDAELSAARFLAILRKLKPLVPEVLANPDVELRQAQLQARIEELQRTIGEGLQPIIADILQNIVDISESEWVADLVAGIEVLQGKHDVPIFEDLKLGILTVQTAWDVLVTDLGEGWQMFMDATGLAGTTFDELVTDLEEGWGVVLDAIEPVTDAVGWLGDTVYDVAVAFTDAFARMADDVRFILGPIGNVRDALENVLRMLGIVQGTNWTPSSNNPNRNSGGGGNSDRNTSNANRRENERNGTPIGDP